MLAPRTWMNNAEAWRKRPRFDICLVVSVFVTKNWQQSFSVLRECNPSFCFVGYNIKINPSGGKQKTLTARNAMGANWERKLKKAGKTKRNQKQEKGKGGGKERKEERKRNVIKETELSLRNQPPSWWWRGLLLLFFSLLLSRQESLKIQCTSKKYKKKLTKKRQEIISYKTIWAPNLCGPFC